MTIRSTNRAPIAQGLSNTSVALPHVLDYQVMSRSVEIVLKEALMLQDDERAELVVQLLDSLPPAGPRESRSDEEWIAEIERRAHAALAGSRGLDWEAARAQITKRLGRK
jgi:putative addiction module component (TIGR02574 family)